MKIYKIKNLILREYIKKQNDAMRQCVEAQHNFSQDIDNFILKNIAIREKNSLDKINCKKNDKKPIKI